MAPSSSTGATVVKFQVNQGWAIGQFLIPPSTIIDIGDKRDDELTEWERLAKGHCPPIDAAALDADCALLMWRGYPWHRERLCRRLDPFNEQTFGRLLAMDETTVQRYWPQGKG